MKILIAIDVFLIPFYFLRFSVMDIKTNVFEIFTLIIFIAFLIDYSLDFTIKKFNFGPIWVYLFLLAALVGTFISGDIVHAAGILKGWFLFPIILYLLIINNFSKENVWKLAIPVYFSLMIVSIWAVLQKNGIIGQLFYQVGDNSFLQYIAEGRAFGPFESPNYLAMFLVPTIYLSLPILGRSNFSLRNTLPDASVGTGKRGLRFLFIASFLLPVSAIYFSTSRGGAVALLASIVALVLFLYFKSKEFRKNVEKASNVLIFALIFVVTLFLIYAVRIISPNEGGDSVRLEIYRYTIDIIKNNPILGIGLGEFQSTITGISANNSSFQEFGLSYALHPHNLYMALWLNLGIAGLIVFMILIVSMIKNLFKNKNDIFLKSCLFATLIAILVHGLFDTTYFKNDLSAIFWLVFAIAFISRPNENTRNH